MPNHYHLLVRTPRGNLSRCMRHVNATYTQRVNLRRGWDGPLFRGRFHSQLVEEDRYLDQVFAYVHLNPLRAGLATRLDDPCWTSLRAYLGRQRTPEWLTTDFFAGRLGGGPGIAKVLKELRKGDEHWSADLDLDTGWIRAPEGQPPRRRPAPAQAPPRMGVGEVLRGVAEVAGCSVADVKRSEMGPGANPARRLAVWALSRAQVYSHGDIAKALGMSEGQVAKVLWRLRREGPPEPLAAWMATWRERQVSSGRS
jgi:hypothetical protein